MNNLLRINIYFSYTLCKKVQACSEAFSDYNIRANNLEAVHLSGWPFSIMIEEREFYDKGIDTLMIILVVGKVKCNMKKLNIMHSESQSRLST